jgi:hypothetical protein
MLRAGGFHRVRNGALGFGSPSDNWRPAWAAIEAFVEQARELRRPVLDLLAALKAAPYGLREGPIPVLLTAFLVSRWDEVALYEEGAFVPELRIEVLERLTRRPESFELQSHQLDAHERRVLKALDDLVGADRRDGAGAPGTRGLLPIVKSLVLFAARLHPYVKQTARLGSRVAQDVRDQLLRAGEPRKLLFQELPAALGVSIDGQEGAITFARQLQQCLRAVGRAYPDLLDEVEKQIREVFELKGSSLEARKQLLRRATPLVPFAVDQKLQLFVREAAREQSDRDWREVLARVINGGIPPSHWRDADVTAFQVRLNELAGQFTRLEELVAERQRSGVARVLRIGVLDGLHRESRAVIPIDQEVETAAIELASRVRQVLDAHSNGDERARHARLAALATVAEALLAQPTETEAPTDVR